MCLTYQRTVPTSCVFKESRAATRELTAFKSLTNLLDEIPHRAGWVSCAQ